MKKGPKLILFVLAAAIFRLIALAFAMRDPSVALMVYGTDQILRDLVAMALRAWPLWLIVIGWLILGRRDDHLQNELEVIHQPTQ